jgi:DNA-binding NarL/FixJ family response regulator
MNSHATPQVEPVNVLLASNRPSVHTFVTELGRWSSPPLSVISMPLRCSAVREHQPQVAAASVVMVDVGSDPDEGVQVCAALRALRGDLRILVIVCCPKPTLISHVQQFLSVDVDGILDAEVDPGELVAALSATEKVGRARLRLNRLADTLSPLDALNVADRQLLALVARGMSDADIGAQMNLSERAVRNRIERTRNALGIEKRTELAAWAGAHGLYAPRTPSSN